jgi:16S rRNA (guanine527-N7)-methyltransferase
MVNFDTFKGYLKELCSRNGIDLNDWQLEKFYIYLNTLLKWNKVHNLTAIKDWREIALRHFCDSLTLVKFFEGINYPPSGKSLVDVGSGAGFPGVPLKIYYGDSLNVFLIESVSKKCSFLQYLKKELKLNYTVLCSLAQSIQQKFDIAVARALEVKGKKTDPLEYAMKLLPPLAKELIAIQKGKNIDFKSIEKYRLKVFELDLPDFKGQKILYKFLQRC